MKVDQDRTVLGLVKEIVHDPARCAPVARVVLDNDEERYILVPEGVYVGQEIGPAAPPPR